MTIKRTLGCLALSGIAMLATASLQAAEAVSRPSGMQEGVPFVHIVSDAKGESHFEDGVLPFNFIKMPSGEVAGLYNEALAGRASFMMIAPGTFEDWHPSPASQLLVVVQGEVEVGASDGSLRHLTPGMVFLMDDVKGKGHTTRTIGNIPHIGMMLPKAVKK